MPVIDFYIQGIFPQAVSFAGSAKGSSPVSRKQYPELNLVQIFFYFLEKRVDAQGGFTALPQKVFLCLGKVGIGPVHREIELLRCFNELLSPPVHFLALPWGHSAVKNAQPVIRNNKIRVNAQDL